MYEMYHMKNWLFINDQDTGIKNVKYIVLTVFPNTKWVKVQTVQVRNKS